MKYYFLSANFLLLISLSFNSQSKEFKYYFDKDLNFTTQAESVLSGTGIDDNGLIQLKCYNNRDKSLVLIAHFTDSSLAVLQGLFQSFYSNGKLEKMGKYIEGKEDGLWESWYVHGKIKDSILYNNGGELRRVTLTYFRNLQLERVLIDDNKNKTYHSRVYNNKGKIISETDFDKKIDNDEDIIFTKAEIEASFPGGMNAWTKYITELIEQNKNKLKKDDNEGTCIVYFVVNKDGSVSDIKVRSMIDSKLAEIIMDAIKNGPKWKPALQNGRSVNAYKQLSVTYPLNDN